ncbi:hypothetical protein Droror1_Dr00018401 [Drosera rotundifolia]
MTRIKRQHKNDVSEASDEGAEYDDRTIQKNEDDKKKTTKTTKKTTTIEGKKMMTREKKDRKPTLLEIWCVVPYFRKKIDELRDVMSDACLAEITSTPFAHLKASLDRITLYPVGSALGVQHTCYYLFSKRIT